MLSGFCPFRHASSGGSQLACEGRFFVYLRNAQGSRNAPICWGRVAALIGRLTQSMFNKAEARIEIYTDDPCIALRGTREERDSMVATIVALWLCLGLPLSWKKGSRGTSADWIGGEFRILPSPAGVKVRIKQQLLDEAQELARAAAQESVISTRALRTLVGKLSNIANLLVVWRPFLAPMFAALYANHPAGAPPHCIWTKQILPQLGWLAAFFRGAGGFAERYFDLSCFLRIDTVVDIVLDASPWGLAGVLCLNGTSAEYFSDAISPLDVSLFEHIIGEASGQQVWECLAALVAVRLWRERWQKHQAQLMVRGDSVAMLTLLVNMRPHSPQMRIIAQEMALDMAHYSFVPVVAHHIPGIANVVADELSRWPQPGHVKKIPEFLVGAVQVSPAIRTANYYMTNLKVAVPFQEG